MCPTILALALALTTAQTANEARPANPLAPSLPQLTPKEAEKYEAILERFIQFDIGKLTGAAGKKAVEDFHKLPAEAIFVLIDGFNQAANMEASCPAVVIGKKIITILNSSEDLDLLAFAKENLGAGVTAKRHLGMLKDVQFSILLRKGAVQRKLAVAGTASKSPGTMSLPELLKAVDTKKGAQLRSALAELEKRPAPQAWDALASAAASPDKEVRNWGAGLLARRMTRQSDAQLKDLLSHERPEVKAAAAKLIGTRALPFGKELVDLLEYSDPAVHQAARAALRQLSGGLDFGPEPDAGFAERAAAGERWRAWWMKQKR